MVDEPDPLCELEDRLKLSITSRHHLDSILKSGLKLEIVRQVVCQHNLSCGRVLAGTVRPHRPCWNNVSERSTLETSLHHDASGYAPTLRLNILNLEGRSRKTVLRSLC